MPAQFVHLHLHTEFSLVDSTIRVPEKPDYARPEKAGDRPNLLSRAVELQLPALAITDRNNLFALVKFYKAAESVGIKPIAGADVLIADGGDAPSLLTLLCRDHSGYLSLSRLLSRAWLEGQRGDCVAINPEWLRDDHAGLFAIAGRQSLAGRMAVANRHDIAEAQLAEWRRVFGADLHLELTRTGREFALRAALADVTADYDTILLDCSPSLGVLTINALTAADEVLIPLQCETLSHRGVGQLLDTIGDVRRITNRDLTVLGVLPTLYDARTTHARAVLADISDRYGLPVLVPPIPRSIRFAEAPAAGRSVLSGSRFRGAQAYRELAQGLVDGSAVSVGAAAGAGA